MRPIRARRAVRSSASSATTVTSRGQVSTLDNLDTADGPLLAVLVLGDLGRGTIGHYGFGDGAERAVPEWWVE